MVGGLPLHSDDSPRGVALTAGVYREVRARLAALGHVGDWEWSQNLGPPKDPEALVCEYTWVVLNSGMKNTVARKIFDRVWPRLCSGELIYPVFMHGPKVCAIESVWIDRARHLSAFLAASDKVGWCQSLPWIGPITKYHLAKNLGVDCAKPDRWLVRLAQVERTTVHDLCARLARETGDRVATVDVVLWRACAIGVLVVVGDAIAIARTGVAAPEGIEAERTP
jgi:hypothetical protein